MYSKQHKPVRHSADSDGSSISYFAPPSFQVLPINTTNKNRTYAKYLSKPHFSVNSAPLRLVFP
jgi:hypothetical protein